MIDGAGTWGATHGTGGRGSATRSGGPLGARRERPVEGMGLPGPATGVVTERDLTLRSDSLTGWNLLLWNDDVHSMDYVVAVLVRTLAIDPERAIDVMLEAHYEGKAVAWSGAREIAEMYRDNLESAGLTATISR